MKEFVDSVKLDGSTRKMLTFVPSDVHINLSLILLLT